MDWLSTMITAGVLVAGQGDQHHITGTQPRSDMTTINKLRYGAVTADRLRYLSSDRGRDYWQEQYVEIPKMKLPPEFRGATDRVEQKLLPTQPQSRAAPVTTDELQFKIQGR